ncbi:MAG: hypothetical protein O7J95_02905 [Planctomycetota bacterium]|nr:hypothetical protein [Planctomycetota bacterium]
MKNASSAGRRLSAPLALVLPLFGGLIGIPATAVAESTTLAEFMPPGAIGYAEVAGLAPVIERIRTSNYLELLTGSAPFRELENSGDYQKAQAGRKILETHLGLDLWTLGKKLLGERVAVGLYITEGESQLQAVGLLRVSDTDILPRIRERLAPFLVLGSEQIERSETADGVEVLDVAGRAFVALDDRWIAVSGSRDLLGQALALLTGKLLKGNEKRSLADDEQFRAMMRQVGTRQVGSDHLVQVFANTEAIRQAAGGRFAPEKLDNPLGSLLVGGIMELAAQSPYVELHVDVTDGGLALTASVAGDNRKLGEAHQSFFSSSSGPGTPPIPALSGVIGGFSLYRDFTAWYRHREDLLQDQVLPGFDKFETGLANVLPGKDFGEDVLPLIGSTLTFVAAPQDYSHLDGRPGVEFPGFGLIVDLARPREAADLFQVFFQTLTALLNIQAGQQGRQPWVMTSETYQGVQISYARYLEKPSGDRLPLAFNFLPASARVADKFVLSSSLGLCRQLVAELQKPTKPEESPNRNFNFEVHADALADIFEANQEFFHARFVQSGTTREEAKEQFSTLLEILRAFDLVRLSTGVRSEAFEVKLEVHWK